MPHHLHKIEIHPIVSEKVQLFITKTKYGTMNIRDESYGPTVVVHGHGNSTLFCF